MKFGFAIPTCREGRDNLSAFAGPKEIIKLTQMCERLGFDSVWSNDFINPPPAMRKAFGPPPNWYEVITSFASLAVLTERIKLGIGVIVMPFREPVLLAKQVATLDAFSNGRTLLGMGVGGSRDEFVSIRTKEAKAHRGTMLDEGLEAVTLLLNQPEASFEGKYYEFRDVALYPKPVQKPLPIYIAGHSEETPHRVAKWAHGWLVSYPSTENLRHRWEELKPILEQEGRDPSEIDVTVSWGVSLAQTREAAIERYRKSLQGKRIRSEEWLMNNNLVGTPAEVAERLLQFEKEGATHCIALHIAADTFPELEEQAQIFGEEVIPLCRSASV